MRHPIKLSVFTLCALSLTACTHEVASCPQGTVREGDTCIESPDGGGPGGFANGDSTGFGGDASFERGLDGSTPMDASTMDGGPSDAGLHEAGTLDDASMDAGDGATAPNMDATIEAGAPDAGPCAAQETCNTLDDDCDGKTDEGLLVAVGSTARSWAVDPAMTRSSQRGLSSVLPRAAGGAWLLYKALAPDPTAATTEDGASALNAVRLDADNAPAAAAQEGLVPSSRSYLAASYGPYVAVLFHAPDADGDAIDEDNDGNGRTELALWKDDGTGVLVQQGSLYTVFAKQTDMSGIALHQTTGGELRILVAYSDATDNISNATGVLAPYVHAFGYDSGAGALYEVHAATQLVHDADPDANAGATVRIVRRPCDPGWIIGYFEPPSAQAGATLATREVFLRGVSIDGEVASQPLWRSGPGFSFQGLGVHETCEPGAARLLVLVGDTTSVELAHELVWSATSPETDAGPADTQGSISATILTKTLPGAVQPAQIVRRSGLWFASLRGTGVAVEGVLEIDPTTSAPVRVIALPSVATDDAGTLAPLAPGRAVAKHVRDVNMYFAPIAGLASVDDGLLATYANATSDPTTSSLGAETAAVSYQIGCTP